MIFMIIIAAIDFIGVLWYNVALTSESRRAQREEIANTSLRIGKRTNWICAGRNLNEPKLGMDLLPVPEEVPTWT